MARYSNKGALFINPYNFVPVNLKKTKRSDITQKEGESLTGYFDCRIKCRTPLAIPDTSRKVLDKESREEHFIYPFFTVDGVNPLIPGSAVRGVIRNVYETLTDSCFGTMQKDTRITMRSSDVFQPGLLKKESETSWKLYKAKRYLLITDKKFYEDRSQLRQNNVKLYDERKLHQDFYSGEEVRFREVQDSGNNPVGYKKRNFKGNYVNLCKDGNKGEKGYICIGERAPRRHFQSVFEEGEEIACVSECDIVSLESVLAAYRDETINRQCASGWYKDYEQAKKNGVIPIYYSFGKGKDEPLYMSFAAIGRKAFKATLNSKAGEKAHEKCDSRKNLCPACALFGTTEGEGIGSRVRFTDAVCRDFRKEQIIKKVTFAELGSPRISYLPFYLRRSSGNASYKEGYDSPGLTLRGRKYYWHHIPDMTKKVKKNQRNATFDVLDSGAELEFRVYFDGISERQLELLAAALHLNENDMDGRYCHKLGHGKPLGYGSIKICIEDCVIREYSAGDGEEAMTWKETHRTAPCSDKNYTCGAETYEALRTISDFDATARQNHAEVCYPEVVLDQHLESQRNQMKENDLASHKWFSQNYRLGSENPNCVLPEINQKGGMLKKYVLDDIGNGGNTRRNSSRPGAHGKGPHQGGKQNYDPNRNNRNGKNGRR